MNAAGWGTTFRESLAYELGCWNFLKLMWPDEVVPVYCFTYISIT